MTAIEALAAEQTGLPDPMSAAEQLTALLDLPSVGLRIRGARIVGRGARASADIRLSDNTEINFESLRDVGNASRLTLEVAACTGATPRLKAAQAVQAVALLRALAEHHEVTTLDQIAVDWGLSFLQAAETLDVDLSDQRQRWDAFQRLEALDPVLRWRQDGLAVAKASLVLRHSDGTRLVRTGWFRAHVRAEDHNVSPQEIAHRMERIGWTRSGATGRVKATRPDMAGSLAWSFHRVPKDWEEHR